ncbi:unnamed protein product (macronuclear) [Paramecium tetraurelia]|uniref:Uncharacterized protein n=1 Tax=Paramecium tetraurelia TaxID=5888 RepID=A0BHF7_PARTE|nr:uncharacterized protein GSPATT00029009001 [Paramecium tetraurelia]CAK57974.1 unnamed protein product [Paramecium tetraurelia]|eukprot:XP_001425372.1 hypothetical protein (macronuclear) [Paramecium tetraurelia strain d4-2]
MNQVMNLGCVSNKLMDTYAVQVFCMNTWDHCCLIYHKKKMIIKYHYLEQKIVRQILWCKKKSYRIFDISMSKKQRLYFLLCQDWFIYFLNFDFQIVNKVQMECKQFTNLLFLDHLSTFVMVQFNSVSAFEIQMKDKFNIVKYQELSGSLDWNRQCKLIDYFYILYNSQNITIYDLRTLKHLGSVQLGLTISDVYFINDLLYLGDVYGTLWCYDLNGTLQYFHEHAHDGQIVNMVVYKEELFTVANDLFIKVWKLNNLIFCQSYPIYQQQIQYFKFINYSKYFLQSADQLFLCDLHHILQAYYLHNSSVSAMSEQCIAFKNHVYYSNQSHKVIFAPNSVYQVLQIIDSPNQPNTYYLHLQNQTLAKWVNNQQVDVLNFDKIRTINGDKINQDITFIQIIALSPPLYDVELTIDSKDQNKIAKMLENADQSLYFVMGCSKGAVICIPLQLYTIIYTRVNYNKNAISSIIHFNDQLIIKSIDNVINFVQISSNKASLIKSIKILKLGPIHLTQSKQLAVAQSNDLYLFNSNLVAYETNAGHETEILQITSNKNFVVSNSQQQIKIWTNNGFCLFTINFHVQIDYIFYMKDDLIISLNGGLCQLLIPEHEEVELDTNEYNKIQMIDLAVSKKKSSLKEESQQLQQQSIHQQKFEFKKTLELPKIKLKIQNQDNFEAPQTPIKNKKHYNSIQTTTNKSTNISISNSQAAPISQSFDYSIQHAIDSSCVLPAIPKQKEDTSLLNQYLNRRVKKGQPRNRREWTLDKKILGNILSLI